MVQTRDATVVFHPKAGAVVAVLAGQMNCLRASDFLIVSVRWRQCLCAVTSSPVLVSIDGNEHARFQPVDHAECCFSILGRRCAGGVLRLRSDRTMPSMAVFRTP
ncbi:MAG: hypothetical protein OXC53_06355 [Rhodobacteraceae bacterium]|nr:hypothetical protein [Paracoccaceae bacterium]